MIRKKRGIAVGKQYFLGLIAAVWVVSALWCNSFVSLADSTGTVTADSAKIRKETSTNSDVVSSVSSGTTVTITDEVQDSSGTLWYQVSVNGQTGYIRSDLVSKTDDAASSQGDGGQMPAGATVAPDAVLDAQYATVSADKIKVRSAPSTSVSIVDNLNRNDQVIVSGEAQGNDGSTWYYVTFTGTVGSERSGYIRSDLLSLGEMVPVAEEEVPEPQETEPEPEDVINYDYELTYEQTSDGSYAWYLYDYTDDEHPNQYLKYPLEELMKVTKARSESDAADAKTLVRQRVAIVILVVLLALLAGVVVIMALKLRDIYYEDYEDEEEEEEEETPRQRRRRTREDEEDGTQRGRRTQEDEEDGTQRRRRTRVDEETPTRRRRRAEETEETSTRRRQRKEDSERKTERAVRRRAARDEEETNEREVEYHEDEAESIPVKTARKRKTKNFLLDDDEFEFEFLNMEDKN